ncbi:MAG TPA: M23 family metallopeptidase [Acidimicrobiales bacterium]|nr:M23 family metallopeptidase [Acidimicrobiales bacterium]
MVLAGLVAGTVTASTALRPESVVEGDPATLAAPADAVVLPAPVPVVDPPVGSARPLESAIADWEYRSNLAAPVSRATTTPGSLVRPAAGARTGWFGERRRSHRHAGIDFDGDTGDAVVAAGSGVVTHAGAPPSGYGGYGQMVLIDHGSGVTTLYAHLSRLFVGVGRTVSPGDRIGDIGTTGNVTGSHLHFEVRVGDRPVDPAHWIAG